MPAYRNIATLALDRIRSLEVTGEAFTVDPSFDAKRLEQEAFGVVWEKPTTVVVRFTAEQAPYVKEREWHPSQRIRDLGNGRIEMTFRAGGLFEIIRWILGWGEAAEVVRPAHLRREVARALATALRLYRRAARRRAGHHPWASTR